MRSEVAKRPPSRGTRDGDRGDHRHSLKNHPLGLVAATRGAERLDYLQTLEGVGLTLLRAFLAGGVAQLGGEVVEIYVFEKVVDSLGTHLGHKLVGVAIFKEHLLLGKIVDDVEVFLFAEEVELFEGHELTVGIAVFDTGGIDYDVALVVYHGVELLGGYSKEVADLVG